MKKVIILSIISLCCKGQDRSKINYFTPIELSYSQKNDSLLEISPFNILTYTSVNPLIAKQIYEKSQEEFYKLNTNIKYLPNDCQKFIDSYISQKVDSTKSGIFYNTMSNKKNIFLKLSENQYVSKIDKSKKNRVCFCIPNRYLTLDTTNINEILGEFNIPGGYELDKKEINSTIYSKFKNSKIQELKNLEMFYFSKHFKPINKKAFIYNSINVLSKMYLLKGDEVEIVEEKKEWLRIRYYGKKVIEGWIKQGDIE